jgi:hypothetical protein
VPLPGPAPVIPQVPRRHVLAVTMPNGGLVVIGNPEYHGNRRQPSMRALIALPRPPLARRAARAGSFRSPLRYRIAPGYGANYQNQLEQFCRLH